MFKKILNFIKNIFSGATVDTDIKNINNSSKKDIKQKSNINTGTQFNNGDQINNNYYVSNVIANGKRIIK